MENIPSKRSEYEMSQLWSVVQMMHRNPDVLPFGWRQFFYFLDEYADSVDDVSAKMVWLLIEGARRCPNAVLKAAVCLVDPKKSSTRIDLRQMAYAISKQPVDHSAAYLSLSCLNLARPLTEEERASLASDCPVKFDALLDPGVRQDARRWFCACMAFMYEEVRAVSNNVPLGKEAALRLAAAMSQLIAFDIKYPDLRIRGDRLRVFQPWYALWNVKAVTDSFRPLALALTAPLDWTVRNHDQIDERTIRCVRLHAKLAFCCAADPWAPLDLVAMSALLALAEGSPPKAATDYMSSLPCDPGEVPTVPRAYLVPTFSEWAHAPPKNAQLQFEEFMEQVRQCGEEGEEADAEPHLLFREASRRLYRHAPFGVHQSRVYHAWVKLKVDPDGTKKCAPDKRKANETGEGRGSKLSKSE